MGTEAPLRMFVFPFVASGHMIPMLEMAKLFSERGVRVTIISTPINGSFIAITIKESASHQIEILQLDFPTPESALPGGSNTVDHTAVNTHAMVFNCHNTLTLLRNPFRQLLQDRNPDCVVSDMFLPWTADVAAEFRIPRLVFQGFSVFSLCVIDSINRYVPHKSLTGDDDTFVVPGLPHRIEMMRSELPDFNGYDLSEFSDVMAAIGESDAKSYGDLANSFYEMEPEYADHLKTTVGKKTWLVGPLNLISNQRETTKQGESCLSWLDSKPPNSVLYVCFGSLCTLTKDQLGELALGLEASGHRFIWVVRNSEPGWEPEGFEERVGTKGLVIRDWAPQVQILSHPAVGGFVTHCGWNSVLEGVCAGVPMLTWPLCAEQFCNEKLIVQVLRVGVRVGATVWTTREEEKPLISRELVEKAVVQLMDGGDEPEAMRRRVQRLGEMARRAVRKEGSSYVDLGRVIEDLIIVRASTRHQIPPCL